ncbi:MAG TPA: ImmA/IrrE family metallo-endopeptidase [Pyrinomonadaceae bacterium]|nr:ImmA/IrrE family metallo-endopeptidase [Pyrinomonadaceae bacterium]
MTDFELPPGEKWRRFELSAQGIRDFAGVRPGAPLNPFDLARFANLLVVDFDQIKALSAKTREHLLGEATEQWSGGACSHPLPDGRRIVILNPNHGPQRTNATLMEEVSHVFLGHQPSRLKIVAEDRRGRTMSRDYRKADEEEAYATGAAALVPFSSLRRLVLDGQNSLQIAKHFRVSRELVEYRLKVTRLWRTYRAAHATTE